MIAQQARQQKIARGVGQLSRELIAGDAAPIGRQRLMTVVDQNFDLPGGFDRLGKTPLARRFVHVVDRYANVFAGLLSAQLRGNGLRFGEIATGNHHPSAASANASASAEPRCPLAPVNAPPRG